MNRRHFLQVLGGAAAAIALDPDRALWVPGRKTIFLPAEKTILTPDTTLDIIGGHGLQRGDIIEIPDNGYGWPIMAVNPITRQPTQQLQRFIVVSDVTGPTITLNALHPSADNSQLRVRRGGRPRRRAKVAPLSVGETIGEATARSEPDGRWSAELVIKPRDRGWSTKRV